MENNSENIVIAFPNETFVFCLEKALAKQNIKSKIIPVPRSISAGCGMALKVEKHNKEICIDIINKNDIKIEGIFENI